MNIDIIWVVRPGLIFAVVYWTVHLCCSQLMSPTEEDWSTCTSILRKRPGCYKPLKSRFINEDQIKELFLKSGWEKQALNSSTGWWISWTTPNKSQSVMYSGMLTFFLCDIFGCSNIFFISFRNYIITTDSSYNGKYKAHCIYQCNNCPSYFRVPSDVRAYDIGSSLWTEIR